MKGIHLEMIKDFLTGLVFFGIVVIITVLLRSYPNISSYLVLAFISVFGLCIFCYVVWLTGALIRAILKPVRRRD